MAGPSLAERLGHAPEDRLLIVNCDDLGSSSAANLAVLRCMTRAAALRRLDAADARAECRAQVEGALAWGVDPTHIDAHMDVLLARADLLEVYLDLAAEFRLPARMPSPDADGGLGTLARERAQVRGVLFPDHLVYPWPRRTRDVLFEEKPGLPPGVSEVFAHPVLDGGELRAYDPAHAHLGAWVGRMGVLG